MFFVCQCLVLCVQGAVFFVVDGVIGFVAGVPFAGILPADDGFGKVIPRLILAEGEPLVLDDAGIGGVRVGVVDGGVALEIGGVQEFRLKADGAVFQSA